VGTVAEDEFAPGRAGEVDAFPVKEVRAKAVAADATRSPPMIRAGTVGRHRERRARGLAGWLYATPGAAAEAPLVTDRGVEPPSAAIGRVNARSPRKNRLG
jgi:hypothetical protein